MLRHLIFTGICNATLLDFDLYLYVPLLDLRWHLYATLLDLHWYFYATLLDLNLYLYATLLDLHLYLYARNSSVLSSVSGTQIMDRTWKTLNEWLPKLVPKVHVDGESIMNREVTMYLYQWSWRRCQNIRTQAICCRN